MANERAIMKQMVKFPLFPDEDELTELTKLRGLIEGLKRREEMIQEKLKRQEKKIQKLEKIKNAYFKSWKELGRISFSERNELISYLVESGMYPPTIGELKRVREEKPYFK